MYIDRERERYTHKKRQTETEIQNIEVVTHCVFIIRQIGTQLCL